MKIKDQSGLTVVELIVTILVGAILITSAIMLYTSAGRLSQRHRDVVVANAFIEKKIEALRSAGYLSLTDGTTDITNELPSELQSPRSGSLQIGPPSVGVTTGLKKVDVTLTYNDQGTNRTYTYTTYIGELGVGQY